MLVSKTKTFLSKIIQFLFVALKILVLLIECTEQYNIGLQAFGFFHKIVMLPPPSF